MIWSLSRHCLFFILGVLKRRLFYAVFGISLTIYSASQDAYFLCGYIGGILFIGFLVHE